MPRETSDLRGEDIIDSRDVVARIAQLEEWRDEAIEAAESAGSDDRWTSEDGEDFGPHDDWDESTCEELKALKDLESQASGYGDWPDGEGLIADSHFTEYAEQLAEDICAISRDAIWPLNHIDWEAAAEELQADYMSVEFDGSTYWMRA